MTAVRRIDSLQRKLRKMEGVAANKTLNRAAYAGALVVERACKINIREAQGAGGKTGLIDTAFMINSVYTIGPEKDGSQKAEAAARERADREFLDPPDPKQHQAVVTIGAEYAYYLHEGTSSLEGQSFLASAAQTNEKQVGDAVGRVIEQSVKAAVGAISAIVNLADGES